MRHGPTTRLTTTIPEATRILVRFDDDLVRKVALRPCCWGPPGRTLPRLLEAMALRHDAPVCTVASARDVAPWSKLGLVAERARGVTIAHATAEPPAPVRERGPRRRGGGSRAESEPFDLCGAQ